MAEESRSQEPSSQNDRGLSLNFLPFKLNSQIRFSKVQAAIWSAL